MEHDLGGLLALGDWPAVPEVYRPLSAPLAAWEVDRLLAALLRDRCADGAVMTDIEQYAEKGGSQVDEAPAYLGSAERAGASRHVLGSQDGAEVALEVCESRAWVVHGSTRALHLADPPELVLLLVRDRFEGRDAWDRIDDFLATSGIETESRSPWG